MKLRRKAAAIMLSAAVLVGSETRCASAQEAPPDLRMLMNLDLFEPHRNQDPNGGAAPTDDSMLDQIRTLDAMGYLGNRDGGGNDAPPTVTGFGDAPDAASAPDEPPAPTPAGSPSIDVEGPQP